MVRTEVNEQITPAQEGKTHRRIDRIVEKIARNSEIIKNFEDVRILSRDSGCPALAMCDVKEKVLFLNPYTDEMSDIEFLKCLEGLIVHECLLPDSQVLLSGDRYVTIKDIEEKIESENVFVKTVDIERRSVTNKQVVAVHRRRLRSGEKIYRIKAGGGEITVTENHPLLTVSDGVFYWKKSKEIEQGDSVIRPRITTVDRRDRIILSVDEFIDTLSNSNRIYAYLERQRDKESTDKHIAEKFDISRRDVCKYRHGNKPEFFKVIDELTGRGLLPLSLSNDKINVLARLCGYLLSDGWILSTRYVVGFAGTYKTDLDLIKNDLDYLGIRHRYNSRNNSIVVDSNSNFYWYLLALGMPKGRRRGVAFKLPMWIRELDREGKRNFLSGLLGGDGLRPAFKGNTPYAIRIKFAKLKELEGNLIEYLEEIQRLLREFGIRSKRVKVGEGGGVVLYMIEISNQYDNLIRFLQEVGYAYTLKGKIFGGVALKYLQDRKRLQEEGFQSNTLHKQLYNFPVFVLFNPMLSLDYEFVNVEEKQEIEYNGYVYNLTVKDTHNYITGGMVVKNCGHIDKRLSAPATPKNAERIRKQCIDEEGGYSPDLLNIILDMEIHWQYNRKRRVKPSQQRALKELLTITKSTLPKEHILMCFEYDSDMQKEVREVISDRGLSIPEKYHKIYKILDKNGQIAEGGAMPNQRPLTDTIGFGEGEGQGKEGDSEDDSKGKGKGKGKGQKRKKKETKRDKRVKAEQDEEQRKAEQIKEGSQSIKDVVKKKAKENEIRDMLSSMGFSDAEIDALIEEVNVDDLIAMIEHLKKCLDRVLPDLTAKNGRNKVKETIRSKGDRINGFRKIKELDEVVDNIEDFTTVGEYDIEEIRVPIKVRRRTKSIVFIIRDVSGSVASEPLSRIMRDVTVSLIKLAQKKRHRIAVMDFSSDVYPIKDSRDRILTEEYNVLLAKSMLFKKGYSTVLSKALHMTNEVIEAENLKDNNVNVYIISDSYVDDCKDIKIDAKKVNMVGLWAKYGSGVNDNFSTLIKEHKGRLYKIEQIEDRLIATLYESYGG